MVALKRRAQYRSLTVSREEARGSLSFEVWGGTRKNDCRDTRFRGVSIITQQWEFLVVEFAVSGTILKTSHAIAYLTMS